MQTNLLESTGEAIGQLICHDMREPEFASADAIERPVYADEGGWPEFTESEERFWSRREVRRLLERNEPLVA